MIGAQGDFVESLSLSLLGMSPDDLLVVNRGYVVGDKDDAVVGVDDLGKDFELAFRD